MLLQAKQILPTMKVLLNHEVHTIINVELHYDCAKLITYLKNHHRHEVYNLPKDVYVKVQHNPYE